MEAHSNRRRYPRLQRDDKLFIRILAASKSPCLVGETLQYCALDASASGLRLQLACAVPLPSALDLWIDARSCAQKFFMHGLVTECHQADARQGIFQPGVELLNLPITDFEGRRKVPGGAGPDGQP